MDTEPIKAGAQEGALDDVLKDDTCTAPGCGKVIRTMAFKGTGVCGITCHKVVYGDHPSPTPPRSSYAGDPPAVVTINHQDPTAVRMSDTPEKRKRRLL